MMETERKRWATPLVLAGLLLASTSMAGCYIGYTPFDDALPYYDVILQPPLYEWDNETQTLQGNFTLTALERQYEEERPAGRLKPTLQIKFHDEPPPGRSFENKTATFWFSYMDGRALQPGESLRYDFSVAPDRVVDVKTISLRFTYSYFFYEEGRGTDRVAVYYVNQCIMLDEKGGLAQDDSSQDCQVIWEPYSGGPRSHVYYLRVVTSDSGRAFYPPPEAWSEWDEIIPSGVRVLDAMDSFDHSTAKPYDGYVGDSAFYD